MNDPHHPHSLNVESDDCSGDWQDLLEEATATTPLNVAVQRGSYTPVEDGSPSSSIDGDARTVVSPGRALFSRLLLVFVAFLYGTLNVVLRWVYSLPGPPSPSALSTSRGWMAAACFLPFLMLPKSSSGGNERPTVVLRPLWVVAVELGFWNFAAQGLINVGLIYTTAARAAFLTQCSVVMTPLISAVTGTRVRWNVWVACLCAMVGLSVLSLAKPTNGEETIASGLGVGDILVLVGAFCWSCYIFRLSAVGESYPEIPLQAYKTTVLATFYTIWFIIAQVMAEESLWPGWTNPTAWLLLFYSALGPGAVADILQQKGQAVVAAAESNVIISMEPVFTSILAWILLGEITSHLEELGGGLIILAAVIATQ